MPPAEIARLLDALTRARLDNPPETPPGDLALPASAPSMGAALVGGPMVGGALVGGELVGG